MNHCRRDVLRLRVGREILRVCYYALGKDFSDQTFFGNDGGGGPVVLILLFIMCFYQC